VKAIRAGKDEEAIEPTWQIELEEFRQRRAQSVCIYTVDQLPRAASRLTSTSTFCAALRASPAGFFWEFS
jgi:hypothetical protein